MPAEDTRRESEERLLSVLRASVDLLYRVDLRSGRLDYVSPSAETVLGCTPDELMALRPAEALELIHPDDLPVVAAAMERLEATGAAEATYRQRTTDGTYRYLWNRMTLDRDAAGTPIHRNGCIRDVTERRRADEQLARDFEALARLQKLGTLFVREGDLGPFLAEVVDAAISITDADFGNIQLLDPDTGDLRIAAHRGFPQWWLDFWDSVTAGHGVCGTALARGERVIVEDVEQSPIFVGTEALEVQRRAGVRAVQSTPLLSRSGSPLGMFSTHYRTPHRPDPRSLALLDLLARQAADIIARTATEKALRGSDLSAAALDERNRLARDLHDSVTQALFAATMKAEALLRDDALSAETAAVVADVTRLTRGALAQMRTLLLELRGDPLEQVPIAQLLRTAVEATEGRTGCELSLAVDGDPQLPAGLHVALYRIAQEALNNIARHAKAAHAWVDLEASPSRVLLSVRDDGRGFDPGPMEPTHLGLQSMRERAAEAGAHLTVEAAPGAGTSVVLEWREEPGS